MRCALTIGTLGEGFQRASSALPLLVTGCLICACAASQAFSGPLLDAAMQAERLAATGDAGGAIDAIQSGMAAFSQSLPLTVRNVHFITEKPAAFRSFKAKSGNRFQPGDPLITYLELVGLDWRKAEDGQMEAHFTIDMQLSEAGGRTVALKQQFGEIRYLGHGIAQEVFTHLTLDLTGAAPGDYVLRYTVRDVVGERSVAFDQPFSLAGGG